LEQFRLFALKYFLAHTSNNLLTWKLSNWGWHYPVACPGYAPGGNRILTAGYRPAQAFVIERSLCAHGFVIQINQHSYKQSW